MNTNAVQHRTVEHEPSALARWLLAAAVAAFGAAALAIGGDGSTATGENPAAGSQTPSAAVPWGFSGEEAGAAGNAAASADSPRWAPPVEVAGRASAGHWGGALAWFTPEERLAGHTGLVAGATGLGGT